MERKEVNGDYPLAQAVDGAGDLQESHLPIRRPTVTFPAGESNLTTTSSSSTSSSSLSPPSFLKNVQAALKRHRPVGTMSSNVLRARRIPVQQQQQQPVVPPVFAKLSSRETTSSDVAFNQKRGFVSGEPGAPPPLIEDSSLTPPSISGTITTGHAVEVKDNNITVSDPERASCPVNPSSHLADRLDSPNDCPEKVQSLLVEQRSACQGVGTERMTTDTRSLALTEDRDSLGGALPKKSCDRKLEALQQANVSDNGFNTSRIRPLEKASDIQYDPRPVDPMTHCSTMGSACATTMSIHSGPTVQCTHAASAAQTVPTQMSASGLENSGRVQDNATLSAFGKNYELPGHAKAASSYSVEKGRKEMAGGGCSSHAQVPPPKCSSSKIDVDPSHPTKADKTRKKKYDPDVFVKVNGKLYQKLGKIGSGGSSEVYKVISSDCTIYALKKIKLKGRDYPTAYGFCQEIEYLNKLKGMSNIIELVDYEVTDKSLLEEVLRGSMEIMDGKIKDDSYIYMVLEYGEIDLAHMLSQKWKEAESTNLKINENWLRFYWQQMLEAVNTIHEERIVHSDLKPANFLLVKGSLKLIDFGIAKALMLDTTNIQRDAQVGTLNYMSPEAFMWNEHDDASGNTIKCGRPSDIWSLGCILYQMVYGRTPFAEYKTFWAKFKVITDQNHKITYEPISNPWLIDLMKKCLAWDRNERWRIPQLLQHPFLNPPMPPLETVNSEDRRSAECL